MRCLWITRQDPRPANSGELIYSGGLANSLAAAGVEVVLVGHQAPPSSGPSMACDQRLQVVTAGVVPKRTLANFLSPLPSDAARLRSTSLEDEVQRRLAGGGFDAVLVDHAALGWAAELVQRSGKPTKLVYLSHNCEAVIRKQIADHCADGFVKRTLMQRDARKYAALEQRVCRAADLITAITPEDASIYRRDFPGKPVIDLMPGYSGPEIAERDRAAFAELPRRVLMVGSFEWIAKRHNLIETLAAADPVFAREGIELQVVGKASSDFVAEIEQRFRAASFHANVPQVGPYLQQARLGLISETVGGGFKLKSLEYGFNHLPIAALSNAIGGIDLESGVDAIIEPTLDALIASIVARIDDCEFLHRAAKSTYAKFANQFRWPARGTTLRDALAAL